MLLSKEALLAACILPFEDVVIKNLGLMRVQTMTGAERESWRQSLIKGEEESIDVMDFSASILVATTVDELGQKIFSPGDIPVIKGAPAGRFDAAVLAAYRLNGLGLDAVEQAEKNSVSGQSDDSGSGLPKS
jgi:hypothetical protein